jgi:hypothetical protein
MYTCKESKNRILPISNRVVAADRDADLFLYAATHRRRDAKARACACAFGRTIIRRLCLRV